MPEFDETHISPEKLDALAADRAELSRLEFEHIHVCPECLQAYAEAIRERARRRKNKPSGEKHYKDTDLVFQLV
jgi:hypothetical protein